MAVLVKTYTLPPVCEREVLRYAGVRADADAGALAALLAECIREAQPTVCGAVCYTEAAVAANGDTLTFDSFSVTSASLARHLGGCKSAVLFAATIGLAFDRLLAKYSRLSPAKALLLQALGAERIECLCDLFCAEIAAGRPTRPRFSPGYGDLPLKTQTDLFCVLDCPRKIGLSLNDSLLMSPSKSVTAILGVGENTGETHGA